VFDVLVGEHELRKRSDVEARAFLVERLEDLGLGIRLDRVVGLDLGQMTPEAAVVPAQDLVVDDHERRAVPARQGLDLEGFMVRVRWSLGSVQDRLAAVEHGDLVVAEVLALQGVHHDATLIVQAPQLAGR